MRSWPARHAAGPQDGTGTNAQPQHLTPACLPSPPSPVQLLACLRVIAATAPELQLIKQKRARPLAGPINPENEQQAVGALRAALEGLLRPLEALPLLAQQAQHDAAAAAEPDGSAEQQLHGLRLDQQQPESQQQQQQPESPGGLQQDAGATAETSAKPTAQGGCNENGFDADWRMSRHFCRVYLEGQRAILRRSLQECDALAAAAAADSTP